MLSFKKKLFFIVLISLCLVLNSATAGLLTEPYLQNVKTNGITIMWEVLEAEANSKVEYGSDPNYGSEQAAVSSASGGDTIIYTAVLTGLSSSATYHYRGVSSVWTGDDNTFTTAPSGNVDFSFGQWGDSQGGSFEPTSSIIAHLGQNVDIAITTGDLAESGSSYSSVDPYFLNRVPYNLGTNSVPFFIAWGNHDGGQSSVLRNFADLPSKDRGSPYDAGYGSFSFDYSGCHFVCIDYYQTDYSWVESDLQQAAADNPRHIFLFVHVPPYSERWISGYALHREYLVPLLEDYTVDICFSGHTHEYERGFLNDVYYCISGGGSWLDIGESVVYDWPHMTVGGAHNMGGGVTGGLVNEYVRVDVNDVGWTSTMVAFNGDGSRKTDVSDTFSSIAADDLRVLPSASCKFSGLEGGPFDSVTVYLQNKGNSSLNWTASETADWLQISSASGTVAAGGVETIIASITSDANTLPRGIYEDIIIFTDTTNEVEIQREAILSIAYAAMVDDIQSFAEQWLNTGCQAPDWCEGADLDRLGGIVDMRDFAMFAENWLKGAE